MQFCVGNQPIPLVGYEQMSNYTRPVVEGVKPWYDGSVMVVIDNCGNCYSSSWFLIVILWAVQSPGRLRDLMGKLQDGCLEGGALFDIPLPYQVQVPVVVPTPYNIFWCPCGTRGILSSELKENVWLG